MEEKRAWELGGRSLYFRDLDRHLIEVATPGVWSIYLMWPDSTCGVSSALLSIITRAQPGTNGHIVGDFGKALCSRSARRPSCLWTALIGVIGSGERRTRRTSGLPNSVNSALAIHERAE